MIELPFMFFQAELLIVLPVLWKEQWSYEDEGVISDLGNGYFEMRFSLSYQKPASRYETMVVF